MKGNFEKGKSYPFTVIQGKVTYLPTLETLGSTEIPQFAEELALDCAELWEGGETLEGCKEYVQQYLADPDSYPLGELEKK